jgi:beta-N-acetylhexosaminidase
VGCEIKNHREIIAGWLARMTLSEKVGQLLMVGFQGQTPPEELLELLSSGAAGGVILFADNIAEPAQVAELTSTLQAAARQSGAALPLFIAVDQEGGTVIRLSRGVTVFPGNMALGAAAREDYAYRSGKAMAEELAVLGINMNLAPVLDVNNNPDNPIIGIRSFGAEQETVTRMGVAMLQGLQDGGVLAVAKHFPGHGDTTADSHLNLPVIANLISRLNEVELPPFQAAIGNGVSGVMTAHVYFPALEPEAGLPATLSSAVLTGLLRQQLGFTGLIMTDCLEMKAIADNYEIGDIVTRAVLAGADQLLISHTFAKQQAAQRRLLELAEAGTLPQQLLDTAVSRILAYKLSLRDGTSLTSLSASAVVNEVNYLEHEELARTIAAASLTLIRNRRRLLPLRLKPEDELLILSFEKQVTLVETNNGSAVSLAEAVNPYHGWVTQKILNDNPSVDLQEQLYEELQAKRPAAIIIATQDARWNPGQAAVVRKLADGGYPLVVIALRTPYDLLDFPEVDTYVAAYGFRRATLEAIAKLLWGRLTPRGKLPVDLPGLYPIGFGMDRF